MPQSHSQPFISSAAGSARTRRRLGRAVGLLAALAATSVASLSLAKTSGNNGSHDPSRMIESDGKVYIYSTGGGGKSSPDGLAWTEIGVSLPWDADKYLTGNQRIWAPDGIYFKGKYFLYGSLWRESGKASCLVLLTSPTLDPKSPNYQWTNHGIAIDGPSGVTHSVIDAAPVLDQQGNLYVVFGGGYPFGNEENSIILTRMDNETGLALKTDPGWKNDKLPGYALAQGHKEGPYIHFHDGFYYLFWQTGSCCSGASSTYTIHMARSADIKGPYQGDKTFYASNRGAGINGPGHMGIYASCGVERFTYHYYPASGGSVIGHNELKWGSDGWPTVGADAGPLKPCGENASTGGGTGAGGSGAGGGGGVGGSGGAASGGASGAGGTGGGAGAGGSAGTAGSGAGAGGSLSAGGSDSGSGGVAPVAGTSGTGGAGGFAGSGTGNTSGSGTTPSTGGSATAGATSGGSGTTPTPGPDGDDDSGCAISGAHPLSDARSLWLVGAALAYFARRRRAPRASS